MIRLGQATISLERREAFLDGRPLRVGGRAFEILSVLLQADAFTRRAFELADRGAYFSARAEFTGALRGVADRPMILKRFVKDETPWIHLDIAGVAMPAEEPALAPKGASGWGVMALNRLIKDTLEG